MRAASEPGFGDTDVNQKDAEATQAEHPALRRAARG
jgi:hypothetical protein